MNSPDGTTSVPSVPLASVAFHGQHTRPPRLLGRHYRRWGRVTSFNSLSTLPLSAISMAPLGGKNDTNINGFNFELSLFTWASLLRGALCEKVFLAEIFPMDLHSTLLCFEVSCYLCVMLLCVLMPNTRLQLSRHRWHDGGVNCISSPDLIFNYIVQEKKKGFAKVSTSTTWKILPRRSGVSKKKKSGLAISFNSLYFDGVVKVTDRFTLNVSRSSHAAVLTRLIRPTSLFVWVRTDCAWSRRVKRRESCFFCRSSRAFRFKFSVRLSLNFAWGETKKGKKIMLDCLYKLSWCFSLIFYPIFCRPSSAPCLALTLKNHSFWAAILELRLCC